MLEHCSVVLVGPMFGGNVGATCRAIKNTGLGPLRLVRPVYEDHDEALKFSHGAEELLASAERMERLEDAVAGCTRVAGFTVRGRHRRAIQPLRDFAHRWVESALQSPPPTALLFGRERDGLTNEELDHCTDLVWIPSHPEHPSYNLAQAVLLAGYELFTARMAADPAMPRVRPRQTRRPPATQLAAAEELDALYRHLRAAFLASGYAYSHTVDAMVRSYREIFSRARLYRREATMLRGLARQVLWLARQSGRDERGQAPR